MHRQSAEIRKCLATPHVVLPEARQKVSASFSPSLCGFSCDTSELVVTHCDLFLETSDLTVCNFVQLYMFISSYMFCCDGEIPHKSGSLRNSSQVLVRVPTRFPVVKIPQQLLGGILAVAK